MFIYTISDIVGAVLLCLFVGWWAVVWILYAVEKWKAKSEAKEQTK